MESKLAIITVILYTDLNWELFVNSMTYLFGGWMTPVRLFITLLLSLSLTTYYMYNNKENLRPYKDPSEA